MRTTPRRTAASARAGIALGIGLALAPTTAPAQDAPRALPGIYGLRRDGLAQMKDRDAAAAIELGLAWLAKHQDREGVFAGRWACADFARHDPEADRCQGGGNGEYDIGITGLALLAFLGNGAGLRPGDDRETVERGIGWLTRVQSKQNGLLGSTRRSDFIYNHCIAALALCEGFGLLGGEVRRAAAQKALQYLAQHRNPGAAWRYGPRDGKSDTSVTTWCVHACVAGRDFGLDIDPDMERQVLAWLDGVTYHSNGTIGYDMRGQGSSRVSDDHKERFPPHTAVLTASGSWTRTLLGLNADESSVLRKSIKIIERTEPEWEVDGGRVDYYYWYHGATVLTANHRGERWVRTARDVLVENQRTDGAAAGSWDPVGVWGVEGGRVMSTALAVLTLQASYRYARRDPINVLPGGPPFDAMLQPWLAGRYAEAEAALKVLEEAGLEGRNGSLVANTRIAFDKLVARTQRRIETLAKGPDYLSARTELEAMRERWASLPPEEAIEDTLKTFKKDKKVKRAIRAGEELEKIIKRYDPKKSAYQRKVMLSKLKVLFNKYPGTHAALQANKLRRELE